MATDFFYNLLLLSHITIAVCLLILTASYRILSTITIPLKSVAVKYFEILYSSKHYGLFPFVNVGRILSLRVFVLFIFILIAEY